MIALSRRWLAISLRYLILPLLLVVILLLASLRLWILPHLDDRREDIARILSTTAGQKITLGQLTASWQGWRPQLRIQQLRVYDADNRPALQLMDVHTSLAWSSLLRGELRLANLAVDDLILNIHRTTDGTIYLAGINLNRENDNSQFTDWLLKQSNINISHATLAWQDDVRAAPLLLIREVNLSLQNSGNKHKFRLTATPPSTLAQPIVVTGQLSGNSLANLPDWQGQFNLDLKQANLATWQPWVRLPIGINRGFGNLQLQLQIAQKQIIAITANTELQQLSLQAQTDLPRLNLLNLSGRVQWKRLGAAQSLDLRQISLRTQDYAYITPFDFYLRHAPATTSTPATNKITANNLWLQSLTRLAPYMPLTPTQRAQLSLHRPQGRLQKFSASWQGQLNAPTQYQLQGQFYQLGLVADAANSGFNRISGQINANQDTGTLTLNSPGAQFNLPAVLFEPNLNLDTLTAQLTWQQKAARYTFKLTEASFANADLAGTAFGEYQWQAGKHGIIDLTGGLSRGNGKFISRYIPLVAKQPTYNWLKDNFLGGQASDVKFRLAGDFTHFPFHNDKNGLLDVILKVKNGILRPAPDYPTITNINANLHFAGTRMEINAQQGALYGAQLGRVQAIIADLYAPDEILNVTGVANGTLSDFIKFTNTSPIAHTLDNLTVGATATGNAQLQLALNIPLRHSIDTTVAGVLRFTNNNIIPASPIPPLTAVTGKLNFTQAGINIPAMTLRLLDGPATLTAQTSNNSTRLNLTGTMNATGLSPYLDANLQKRITGTSDWQASLQLNRGKLASSTFNSDLLGMRIALPAPLQKAANQVQSLSITTQAQTNNTLISARYGKVAQALLLDTPNNGHNEITRGAIRFNGDAVLPEQAGIWVTGNLALTDFDGWIAQMNDTASTTPLAIAGIDITLDQLDIFNRRFNNVNIRAKSNTNNWRTSINSSAMQGDLTWTPKPNATGTLDANFKRLYIPNVAANTATISTSDGENLPSINLNVDELQLGERTLGKLEVNASPVSGGLNFERIQLTHKDSKLRMSARWRPNSTPETDAKIHFEVYDIGQFLSRFDHNDTIKRGTAVIDGQANWNGTPIDMTVKTLAGNFTLVAKNGQFLKADPGAAKLLGVLSLQALPRRIGLDFRDVFSGGFGFDDITANLNLNRGIIYSSDFNMQGPAATVKMAGSVDLNAQTQQLRAEINPKLSESVALASGLVGGPVVGLGVYVAQKLFKDPFGQAVKFEYLITGAWTDPAVTKVNQ
ncbi:MAG: TIGR02099 family protein [Sulfuriferula sp.]|nr:TIGR02099 family protein [Sulfuriferula sp.]